MFHIKTAHYDAVVSMLCKFFACDMCPFDKIIDPHTNCKEGAKKHPPEVVVNLILDCINDVIKNNKKTLYSNKEVQLTIKTLYEEQNEVCDAITADLSDKFVSIK